MGAFKRILAGLAIFTSVLGLILCLAGIIGVRMLNQSLTERLTNAFDQVITVLVLSQDRLDQVDADLIEVQNLIASQEEAVNEAGGRVARKQPNTEFSLKYDRNRAYSQDRNNCRSGWHHAEYNCFYQ